MLYTRTHRVLTRWNTNVQYSTQNSTTRVRSTLCQYSYEVFDLLIQAFLKDNFK